MRCVLKSLNACLCGAETRPHGSRPTDNLNLIAGYHGLRQSASVMLVFSTLQFLTNVTCSFSLGVYLSPYNSVKYANPNPNPYPLRYNLFYNVTSKRVSFI